MTARTHRARFVQVMRALGHIDGQYYRVRRNLGIKESLFVLLYALSDGEPRSQKDICEEWFLPRTTLNTTVKEQEAAGHVELVAGPGKLKLVMLTDSGRAYAEQLLGPLLDAEETVSSAVIDEPLVAALEAFGERLEAELAFLDRADA